MINDSLVKLSEDKILFINGEYHYTIQHRTQSRTAITNDLYDDPIKELAL
jgi:hypothetical protein